MQTLENKGSQLVVETRQLLIDRPASLKMQKIANDLDISVSWLHSFARGAIENAGCLTVGALNKYLINIKLAK